MSTIPLALKSDASYRAQHRDSLVCAGYNRTKIRIEGDAARDIQLSGIFDADRPQALMLYAAKNADFSVEPEGNDWVIRSR